MIRVRVVGPECELLVRWHAWERLDLAGRNVGIVCDLVEVGRHCRLRAFNRGAV